MNEDLLKKIYDKYQFSTKGTFDQFKQDMADPSIQKKVYDKYLSSKGDFNTFQSDLKVTPSISPEKGSQSVATANAALTSTTPQTQQDNQVVFPSDIQGVANRQIFNDKPNEELRIRNKAFFDGVDSFAKPITDNQVNSSEAPVKSMLNSVPYEERRYLELSLNPILAQQKEQIGIDTKKSILASPQIEFNPDIIEHPQLGYEFLYPGRREIQLDNANKLESGLKGSMNENGQVDIDKYFGTNVSFTNPTPDRPGGNPKWMYPDQILEAKEVPGLSPEQLNDLKRNLIAQDKLREQQSLREITSSREYLESKKDQIDPQVYAASSLTLDQKEKAIKDKYSDVALYEQYDHDLQGSTDVNKAARSVMEKIVLGTSEAVIQGFNGIGQSLYSTSLAALGGLGNKSAQEKLIRRSLDPVEQGYFRPSSKESRPISERISDYGQYQISWDKQDQPLAIYDHDGYPAKLSLEAQNKLITQAMSDGNYKAAIKTRYNSDAIWNNIQDASSTIMTTYALAGAFGTVVPGSGAAATRIRQAVPMFLQFSGGIAQNAIAEGASPKEAAMIGILQGANMAATFSVFPFVGRQTARVAEISAKESTERLLAEGLEGSAKKAAMGKLSRAAFMRHIAGIPEQGANMAILAQTTPLVNKAINAVEGTDLQSDMPSFRETMEQFGLGMAISVAPAVMGGYHAYNNVKGDSYLKQAIAAHVIDPAKSKKSIELIGDPEDAKALTPLIQQTHDLTKEIHDSKDLTRKQKLNHIAAAFDMVKRQQEAADSQGGLFEEEAAKRLKTATDSYEASKVKVKEALIEAQGKRKEFIAKVKEEKLNTPKAPSNGQIAADTALGKFQNITYQSESDIPEDLKAKARKVEVDGIPQYVVRLPQIEYDYYTKLGVNPEGTKPPIPPDTNPILPEVPSKNASDSGLNATGDISIPPPVVESQTVPIVPTEPVNDVLGQNPIPVESKTEAVIPAGKENAPVPEVKPIETKRTVTPQPTYTAGKYDDPNTDIVEYDGKDWKVVKETGKGIYNLQNVNNFAERAQGVTAKEIKGLVRKEVISPENKVVNDAVNAPVSYAITEPVTSESQVTTSEFTSKDTLKQALDKPGYTILNATIGDDGLSPDNIKANKRLKKALIKEFGKDNVLETDGVYLGKPQGSSFIVTGITEKRAMELGAEYGQESILTNKGIIYTNEANSGGKAEPYTESRVGMMHPYSGEVLFDKDATKEDFYTNIKSKGDDIPFSMVIDWSKLIPSEEAAKKNDTTNQPINEIITEPITGSKTPIAADNTENIPGKQKVIETQEEPLNSPPNPPDDIPPVDPDSEMTKMANGINDAYVEGKFGTDALDKVMAALKGTKIEKVYNEVKDKLNKGTLTIKTVIDRVIKDGYGSDADQAVILYDMATLKGKEQHLRIEINESTDPAVKEAKQKELLKTQDEMMRNALANRSIGRDWHNIGKLRQVWADRSANLLSMMDQFQAGKGLDKLTKDQEEYVRAAYNKHRELEAKVKSAQEELTLAREEVNALKKENEVLESLKDMAHEQKTKDRKLKTKDIIKRSNDRIANAKERLRKRMGQLSSGINPENAADIIQIAAEKILQGAVKFVDVVDQVLLDIKDIFPEFTRKDVQEHLAYKTTRKDRSNESKILTNIKKIAQAKEKLTNREFKTAEKIVKEKSDSLKRVEQEYLKARYEWDKERRLDLFKNAPLDIKIRDWILGWQRFAVLSYPTTIAKLMAVVGHGLVIKPFRLGVQGFVYGSFKTFEKAAKLAGFERDFTSKLDIFGVPLWGSLGKYYAAAFRNFSLAALSEHFKGIDMKEITYGDKFRYDEFGDQYGWMQIPGRSHGYIKSFIKNAEFEYAHNQITSYHLRKFADAVKNGDTEVMKEHDITSPELQAQIGHLSVEHGKWSILMNDNIITDKFRSFLDNSGWIGALIRSDFPIIKIPVNFVDRAFVTKYGIFQALIGKPSIGTYEGHKGIIDLVLSGTKTMTRHDQNTLARVVGQGTIGMMFFTLGYMLYKDLKENEDGSWKVGDHTIGKLFMHLPEYESIASGARTAEYMEKTKGESGMKEFITGITVSDFDMAKKNPFAQSLVHGYISGIVNAIFQKNDDKKIQKMVDSTARWVSGMLTPGTVKTTATAMDAQPGSREFNNLYLGDPNKRYPTSKNNAERFWEQLELGIPGLRENVGKKESAHKVAQ